MHSRKNRLESSVCRLSGLLLHNTYERRFFNLYTEIIFNYEILRVSYGYFSIPFDTKAKPQCKASSDAYDEVSLECGRRSISLRLFISSSSTFQNNIYLWMFVCIRVQMTHGLVDFLLAISFWNRFNHKSLYLYIEFTMLFNQTSKMGLENNYISKISSDCTSK